MAEKFFSIIIPTLNEELTISGSIKNLEKQTFKNFDLTFVDGGSTDKTIKKISSYKKTFFPINILKSDRANVSHQRNLGAKSATSKFILFLDADTQFSNTFLDELKTTLQNQPTEIFTCYMDPDENKILSHIITKSLSYYLTTARFFNSPGACGALTGCSKNAFKQTGGYDPEFEYMEDGEFARRAFKQGLNVSIFKYPKFIFSMRRFRKYGYWTTIFKYLFLDIKLISGKTVQRQTEYPSV